jgi:SAM-dependent methyltransferase
LVQEIDAFDLSTTSLADAVEAASRERIRGINYSVGDFNDPILPKRTYDIVFFHASLHHVDALDRLFRRLTFALRRPGIIYVDEYIGPSRTEWTLPKLRAAQAVLDMVPRAARLREVIEPPVEHRDPSEAIRSSEIPSFVNQFFDIIEWRPYGGQIVDLVLPHVSQAWANTEEGCSFISAMLELEQYEMNANPNSTHHVVAVGRLKSWRALARPLARQAVSAGVRRLQMRLHRRSNSDQI